MKEKKKKDRVREITGEQVAISYREMGKSHFSKVLKEVRGFCHCITEERAFQVEELVQ